MSLRSRLAHWLFRLAWWLDPAVAPFFVPIPVQPLRQEPASLVAPAPVVEPPAPVADQVTHGIGPVFSVLRVGGSQSGVLYAGFDGNRARDIFLSFKHGNDAGVVVLTHDGVERDRYDGGE